MGNKFNYNTYINPSNLKPQSFSTSKNKKFNMNDIMTNKFAEQLVKESKKKYEQYENVKDVDKVFPNFPMFPLLTSEKDTRIGNSVKSSRIKIYTKTDTKSISSNNVINLQNNLRNNIPTVHERNHIRNNTVTNNAVQPKIISRNSSASSKNLPTYSKSKILNKLSDYKFIKIIGAGNYGKVFLALHKSKELYALKCIKKKDLKEKDITNLLNEKRIFEQINHPFIGKLHCTFQTEDKLYFTFSYYNGGELFYHLTKLGKFTEKQVRHFSAQIYLALSFLHDKKIIYRDLKPENIMLDSLGNIKLIDFGMFKEGITADKLTFSFCGTHEYIPPEVIKGEGYGFSFDWWSFGIIIFEMLNGFPPFAHKDRNTLYQKILKVDPEFSDEIEISDECKDLVLQLLKKNVKMRINPNEIPKHPWFKSINFKEMSRLKIKSPFIPKVKSESDTSNFDPDFLKLEINSPVHIKNSNIEKNNKIQNQVIFEEFSK